MAGIRGMQWGKRIPLKERICKAEIEAQVAQECAAKWASEQDYEIMILERRVRNLERHVRDLEAAIIEDKKK